MRGALCIAALGASRHMPALVALRDRMRAAGKAPKTILIAVGRQILAILHAMMRSRQPIRPGCQHSGPASPCQHADAVSCRYFNVSN